MTYYFPYATVYGMTIKSPINLKHVYLDVCALCRPFDDQQQVRIRLETSAVELILNHIRQAKLALIVSPAHQIEIEAITEREERQHLLLLLQELSLSFEYNLTTTRQRAETLAAQGLGVADAAHLAFAEAAGAEFISVDDRLLNQCRRVKAIVWCGTPQSFCQKEDLQ